jgi:hypothetical protein
MIEQPNTASADRLPPRVSHISTNPAVARKQRIRAGIVLAIGLTPLFVSSQITFYKSLDAAKPALKRWLPMAEAIYESPNIYEEFPDYLYPPLFLVLLSPLTQIPIGVAGFIWVTVKFGAFVFATGMAWRVATHRQEDLPPPAAVLVVLLVIRFYANDMGHGNVNALILLLIALSLWMYRRNRDWLAGASIALAASIKVTPGIFILYYAFKRSWRAFAASLLFMGVWLAVAPSLFLGWSRNYRMLSQWHDHVTKPYLAEGQVHLIHMNQNLAAAFQRLLRNQDPAVIETENVAIVNLPLSWVRALTLIAQLSVLALLIWGCRGRSIERDHMLLGVEASLLACGMLFLSGISWKAHYVVLVLPYSVVLSYLFDRRYRAHRVPVAALTVLGSACLVLSAPGIAGSQRADVLESYSVIVLGLALVFAAVCLVGASLRSDSRKLEPLGDA